MYGSVFRMRPLAGKTAEFKAIFIDAEARPRGMVAAYMLTEDKDGSIWGLGVFEDEKTYRDNAASPEQNEEYERWRALLQADPEWHDGTIESMPV